MFLVVFKSIVLIIGVVTAYIYYLEKNKKRRKVMAVIWMATVVLWLIVMGYSLPSYNDYTCDGSWYPYHKKELYGIVVNKSMKYFKKHNRHFIVSGLNNKCLDTVYFNNDTNFAIKLFKKYDTLYKKANNDSLFKIVNGKITPIGIFDCGCDTNKYKAKHRHLPNGHKWRN